MSWGERKKTHSGEEKQKKAPNMSKGGEKVVLLCWENNLEKEPDIGVISGRGVGVRLHSFPEKENAIGVCLVKETSLGKAKRMGG